VTLFAGTPSENMSSKSAIFLASLVLLANDRSTPSSNIIRAQWDGPPTDLKIWWTVRIGREKDLKKNV
jgi:hypothetical protein